MATTINSNNTDGVVITPDTSGEIELQSNGVTKAKITANGLQDNNGNSLRGGSFRNLLINGDMQIAQRGTSSTGQTINGFKTCDRYQVSINVAGTWSITQDTDVPSSQGFAKSLKLDCTTANASLTGSSQIGVDTRIEGQNLQHLKYGTSSAETMTLTFWVKSNKTGTYTFELSSFGSTIKSISKSYTIDSANTWEKKTINIEGDTSGALPNTNALGLILKWWLGVGPNWYSGTFNTSWSNRVIGNVASPSNVNLADSTSNYINITGVQLEVGEGASDFEHLPYDVQLQRCQRYYQKYTANFDEPLCVGTYYYTTAVFGVINFNTTMRAKPTGSVSSSTAFRVLGQGAAKTSTAAVIVQRTVNSAELNATVSAGTAGYSGWIRGSGPMYVDFSAEL